MSFTAALPMIVGRLVRELPPRSSGLAGGAVGCTLDATALCGAAGGTYVAATCIRWSPGQQASHDRCETNGGVYLGGEDTCEFGMGRP